MSDILKRALTGVVFLAVMIGCIMYSSLSSLLLFSVIVFTGNWEYYKLQEGVSDLKKTVGSILSVMLLLGLASGVGEFQDLVYIGLIGVMLITALTVFSDKERKKLSDWSHVVYGQFYVTMPFIMLYLLGYHLGYYEYQIILSFFIILWLSDTGAYMFGKYLGSHKLLPKVSPKKTWEGFFGGVLSAMAGAYALQYFGWNTPQLPWYVLGLMVSFLGALGDLFQSQLKRNKGVKDSGNFMPGHGGILDRFDGVLLSVPVIFALVKILS